MRWWERVKCVAPSEGSAWRWSFGAELRARYERFESDAFGSAPEPDRDSVWTRALPFAELRRGPRLRAFAQLVSAFENGDEDGIGPTDQDRVDVLQAFADVPLDRAPGATSLTLRGGRQVLAYGSERLVSARYGPNVPRAFDAATLIVERGAWRVDLLWGRPVADEPGAFDDRADDARWLWMVYGTRTLGERTGVDLYAIGFEDDEAAFDQGAGRESRTTLGSRIFGRERGWDWNVELMGQAGRFDGADVRAWSIATDTGHTFEGLPLEPRLGLKLDVISGDDDPDDPDLQTFNALFPKGKYFGEAGVIGPANLIDVHPSLELRLAQDWDLTLASVLYWRESTGDGIYAPSGQLVRPDGDTDERFIGTQLDAVVGWTPSRVLDASLGVSWFVPGGFVESTGDDETLTFVGFEVRFRF
jgi:hypothetical protein